MKNNIIVILLTLILTTVYGFFAKLLSPILTEVIYPTVDSLWSKKILVELLLWICLLILWLTFLLIFLFVLKNKIKKELNQSYDKYDDLLTDNNSLRLEINRLNIELSSEKLKVKRQFWYNQLKIRYLSHLLRKKHITK